MENSEKSGKNGTANMLLKSFLLKNSGAEKYHQNYFEINPNQPYCSAVVGPKVAKFKNIS